MADYEVEPDDLVAHASHVDALADRLQTAQQAAGTALSEQAYGLLCAFLPPIVNPTGEQAKDTLTASMEGVRGMADNVRTTASAYRDAEQENAAPFTKQLTDSTDFSNAQPITPFKRTIGTTAGYPAQGGDEQAPSEPQEASPRRFSVGTEEAPLEPQESERTRFSVGTEQEPTTLRRAESAPSDYSVGAEQ